MQISYVAIDGKGKKQRGVAEANSEKELVEFLKARGLSPIKLRSVSYSSSFPIPGFKGVGENDLVIFTRQLASMVQTGLTLVEALQIIQKQVDKQKMKSIVSELIANISEGKSFSESLSRHPELFSNVYISLIQAAESGGLLDKVLARLADNLEKTEDLKRRVRSALFYPTIVIIGVIIVVVVLNVFVIPQLSTLYTSFEDIDLPITTKLVLGMSELFTKSFPVLIIGVIAGIIFFLRFKKTEIGIKTVDKLMLKLPVLGGIVTLSILDEVSRTLSILISSGTTILEALTITANVAGNSWYKQAVLSSSTLVEKGIPLSTAFQSQNIFPPVLIQMVKVGESTGRIDESLLKVSEYFERDLDSKIKTLTTALEPIIIVFLGVVVGFLILAVITPIYSLISQIK